MRLSIMGAAQSFTLRTLVLAAPRNQNPNRFKIDYSIYVQARI